MAVTCSSVRSRIEAKLRKFSFRTAVVDQDVHLTFAELLDAANKFVASVVAEGVKPGDPVVISLPNGWRTIVAYVGCFLGGFTAVALNRGVSDADKQWVGYLTSPSLILEAEDQFDRLMERYGEVEAGYASLHSEVKAIFFTSGTTGRPKGICHSVARMMDCAEQFNQICNLNETTSMYHLFSMGYMAGVLNTVLCPLLAGGKVLVGTQFSALNLGILAEKIFESRANSIWVTPTVVSALVRSRSSFLPKLASSLQHIYCGTAALLPTVRERFEDLTGLRILQSYGTSEQLLISVQCSPTPETGVGRPLPGVEMLTDYLKGGEGEELRVRSPFGAIGYLLEDGFIYQNLWERFEGTGDLAVWKNESLHITGRLKDIIIRGGLNVSPIAIEGLLATHPAVQDAAVVGIPHEFWGEEIVAFIETGSGGHEEKSLIGELRRMCADNLSQNTRPDRYLIIPELPRNSTGKVLKTELRRTLS